MGAAIEFLSLILSRRSRSSSRPSGTHASGAGARRGQPTTPTPTLNPTPTPTNFTHPYPDQVRTGTAHPTYSTPPPTPRRWTPRQPELRLDMAAIRRRRVRGKAHRGRAGAVGRAPGGHGARRAVRRKPLKSVQFGLGATFYEYNELAVQFGYITMFCVVLPLGAPLSPPTLACQPRPTQTLAPTLAPNPRPHPIPRPHPNPRPRPNPRLPQERLTLTPALALALTRRALPRANNPNRLDAAKVLEHAPRQAQPHRRHRRVGRRHQRLGLGPSA